jgi:poly(3-hydroxybutyrate) depolymerase
MPIVAQVALLTGLVCLLPLSQASAACGESPEIAGGQLVEVDGIRRSFVVRVPSRWEGKTPAPVVFAFHPFGMNSQYMLSRAPIARSFPDAIAV